MMNDFFNNYIVESVVTTLIGIFIFWVISFRRFKKDEKIIIDFLTTSTQESSWGFRTTQAICAKTNIPEDRIRKVCAKSGSIRRNEKEKESWALSKKSDDADD